MTRNARKTAHEEGEQETVSFDEIIQEVAPGALARLSEKIDGQMNALAQFLAEREQRYEQALSSVLSRLFPEQSQEANPERPRVQRRRSLDDMQFALRRLMQPEPRPADDDSPQVLQDAINEVIALRQITSDLMQTSMNVYQRGLTAIRDMTSK